MISELTDTSEGGKLRVLWLAGHDSHLPADQEERRSGRPEDGSGEGQRSPAGPGQRVGQHAERRLLRPQTQRGKKEGLLWFVTSLAKLDFLSYCQTLSIYQKPSKAFVDTL